MIGEVSKNGNLSNIEGTNKVVTRLKEVIVFQGAKINFIFKETGGSGRGWEPCNNAF